MCYYSILYSFTLYSTFTTYLQLHSLTLHSTQGPTAIHEVWEEGYALNELTARVKMLEIKRNELEIRQKELQKTKRAVRRKSNNNNNMYTTATANDNELDVDMDLG